MKKDEEKSGGADQHHRPAIVYARSSTLSQGESGIGLDAQLAGIEKFANVEGYDVVGVYTDVASARHEGNMLKRPGLISALKAAAEQNAVLIVSDWTRLTRHEADMPKITALLPERRILSVEEGENLARASKAGRIARSEKLGDEISRRTKEGMARKKALDGIEYGNPNILVTQPAGTAAAKALAQSLREAVADVLEDLDWPNTVITHKAMAGELNARELVTGQHKAFTARNVVAVRKDAEVILTERRAQGAVQPTLPVPDASAEEWQKPAHWGRF